MSGHLYPSRYASQLRERWEDNPAMIKTKPSEPPPAKLDKHQSADVAVELKRHGNMDIASKVEALTAPRPVRRAGLATWQERKDAARTWLKANGTTAAQARAAYISISRERGEKVQEQRLNSIRVQLSP